MPLIVEDGSGTNPLANSYVSETEIIDFAALRGITVTDDQATIAGINAMDYLFSIDTWLQGTPTSLTQPLPYPKTGIIPGCADADELPNDAIPSNIINAQLYLSIYSFEGMGLAAPVSGQTVKREKVDVIVTAYMTPVDGGAINAKPEMPMLRANLTPISVGCGVVSGFTTVRV